MFSNVGGKIKTLAAVIAWLGIIASIIVGIIMIVEDDDLIVIALLIMVLGSFISWIGSFLLYGYGQLIQNTDRLVEMYGNTASNSNTIPDNTTAEKINTLKRWKQEGLITEEEYNQKLEML